MKKIFYSLMLILFAVTAQAQTDQNRLENEQEETTDRIQQEPRRDTQTAVDRAARATDINTQNNQNVISAQDRLQSEKERSTGKPDNNPARTNPRTVRPVNIADPPSNPGQR